MTIAATELLAGTTDAAQLRGKKVALVSDLRTDLRPNVRKRPSIVMKPAATAKRAKTPSLQGSETDAQEHEEEEEEPADDEEEEEPADGMPPIPPLLSRFEF